MNLQSARSRLRRLYNQRARVEPDSEPPNDVALARARIMAADLAAAFGPISDVAVDAEGGFGVYGRSGQRVAWGVARNSGASHWVLIRYDSNEPVRSTDSMAEVVNFLRAGDKS